MYRASFASVCGPRASSALVGWALGVVLVVLGLSALGAPRQVLRGHVPEAVAGLAPVGRLAASNQLDLVIGLPLRNQAELNEFLRQITDPANPNYRHFLTPEQFTERFGPTERDYEALAKFAAAHRFAVVQRHPNRMLLEVRGTVADVEQTFGVTLRTYRHPTEARTFFAPDTEPSVEADFPVLTVAGLNNYVVPHPMGLHRHSLSGPKPALTGSGLAGLYAGYDFRAAYVPGTTLTGAGQTLGLVEFGAGFTNSDILNYESMAGLPNVPVQAVLLDGYGGGLGNGNDEVSLDIEMAISMAPGLSKILVYEGTNTDTIMSQIVTNSFVKTIGTSWTYPIDATTDALFQEMAAQGQSFFNAAGDSDAYASGAAVPTPAGDTNITIVGGTALFTAGPQSNWVSEIVWQNGNVGSSRHPAYEGTGGGVSSFPIPPWQQGINMATNSGSINFRNLPDVALTATNILLVFSNGLYAEVSGTSCATPLWAAFTALVNQQAASAGASPMGFINPAIYAIGQGSNYTKCFHDITVGNNTNRSSPNLYFACPGYDLCTGWGSPAGTNLINALAPPLLAMFTASPTNGVVPLTVAFTNLSLGATNYSWTFGDGHTSTAVNPSNTYTNVGTYSVTLVASTSSGTNVLTLTNYIVVTPPPPVAAFSAGPTSGVAPLLVSFTNATSGATNYLWAFGDGHTSTNANPTETYTNAGVYSVTLTAFGAGGTNIVTRANYVAVTAPPPVASFSAGPTNGFAPLLVSFTNASSGASSYNWTFGDGHTSTNASPTNIYANPGIYSVALTAIGAGGTNSLTRTNFIEVATPPPVVAFTAGPTNGVAPLSVSFTNQSTWATSYSWTFGNGDTSTNVNPTEIYTNPGVYSVTLSALGAGGSNVLTRTNFIAVATPPPVAAFTAGPTSGVAPLLVAFTNQSTWATNYAWAFGNGDTTTNANPTENYTNPGIYSVTLSAFGAGGSNILTRTNFIAVATPPPVAAFAAGPTNGVAPLSVSFTNQSTWATSYAWAFGNGDTSTNVSPTEIYTNPGIYSVTLSAFGAGGSNVLARTNFIAVAAPPPVAMFSASPTNGFAPLLVSFNNQSSGAMRYAWTFGDGGSSTNVNPSELYTNAGTYSVTLTAIGTGGSNSVTLTNCIVVATVPPGLLLGGAMYLASGEFQFVVTNSDGTPITALEQSRIQVYASTNVAAVLSNWLPVTGSLVLTNGYLLISDPDTFDWPWRFYRAVLTP